MWLFHICLDRTRRRASTTSATTTSEAVGSSWPRSKRWWSFLSDTPASSRLSESRCINMWLAFHRTWIRISTRGHKTWRMKPHEMQFFLTREFHIFTKLTWDELLPHSFFKNMNSQFQTFSGVKQKNLNVASTNFFHTFITREFHVFKHSHMLLLSHVNTHFQRWK